MVNGGIVLVIRVYHIQFLFDTTAIDFITIAKMTWLLLSVGFLCILISGLGIIKNTAVHSHRNGY